MIFLISGYAWYWVGLGIVILACFLIVPITKTFFDEELEMEDEKEKHLLNQFNNDYIKRELELAGVLDITLKYEAVVNRPIKQKGNWKVYLCWELPYHSGGKQQKLHYQISDADLTSILKDKREEQEN